MYRKTMAVLVGAAFLVVGGLPGMYPAYAEGESVSISGATNTMNVGGTINYSAVPSPDTDDLEWSSNNTSVATVSGSGKNATVTGVGGGTAVIQVRMTSGGAFDVRTVTVNVPVTAVLVTPETATLNMGASLSLSANVLPAEATDKSLAWTTSNANVATVNSSGVVTPTGAGVVTITARNNASGQQDTCVITVPVVAVTGISLNKSNTSLVVGLTETLVATVAPATATTKTVYWSSGNTSVATVGAGTGTVTAVGAGSAIITAITADGGKIATCTVTVTAATNPITDLKATAGDGKVDFTFSAPTGATSVKLYRSTTSASSAFSDTGVTLTATSKSATVTGLTSGTTYWFKLIVTGGTRAGESNVVSAVPTGVIYSQSPAAGATGVVPETKISFRFNKDMRNNTVIEENIYLRKSGSSTNIPVTFDYSTSSRTVTLTPKTVLDGTTKYIVYLTSSIRDASNNAIGATNWEFTTGTGSFAVVEKTPAASATGILPGVFVEAKFNRDVDTKTLDVSSFVLTKTSDGSKVPATVTYRSATRTATLTPTAALIGGAQYKVTLTRDIKDTAALRLPETVWYFTVKSTGITVSSQYPAPGATQVPVDASVSFRFSDDVLASNIHMANVYILDPRTNIAAFSYVTYDKATRLVTIRPYAALAGNHTYKVVVNSAINGVSGDKVVATEWSFVTENVVRYGTEGNPVVKLNGTYVDFTDAAPYVRAGRTYLPMRALFELLGAQLSWDNARQKVTATLNGKKVELFIGKKTAYRNGVAVILDAVPELRNGRTMLPVRFVAESLGVAVAWDKDTYTVVLGAN
jgi:uncharacterized protein YjdB